jgi:hypothetical protein
MTKVIASHIIDPAFKASWVAALRSGKFSQSSGYLARLASSSGWGYCCYGVACELKSIPSHIDTTFDGACDIKVYGGHREKYNLPPELDEVIKPNPDRPDLGPDAGGRLWLIGYSDACTKIFLDSLNDAGTPFSEIADIIEKYF